MGRFAEHERIVAPVAQSSIHTCPGRQGLPHRGPGDEARTERRSHGLDHRPFVYSEITPTFDRGGSPLAWEQRD
jgi:hypothetical protein